MKENADNEHSARVVEVNFQPWFVIITPAALPPAPLTCVSHHFPFAEDAVKSEAKVRKSCIVKFITDLLDLVTMIQNQ